MITKEQAIDILEKFDFFQSQQQDIKDFSRDCQLLIEYVKGCSKKDFFTIEEVRKMNRKEVAENYTAIMDSMKRW